jgi:drug/metabolite transporter (DMT)-like permease
MTTMNKNVGKTFFGLSGVVWCLVAGLMYGTQNVFAKLAYERGLQVPTFILMRHLVLLIGAFFFGKLRGISFDLRIYPR